MRATTIALFVAALVASAPAAQAQCFGETADAYGCGVSAPREGTLQSFGPSNQVVIPAYNYGRPNQSVFDGLFTKQEQRSMLRHIVISNLSRSHMANQAFARSMNYNARALRRQGNASVGVWGGWGAGW